MVRKKNKPPAHTGSLFAAQTISLAFLTTILETLLTLLTGSLNILLGVPIWMQLVHLLLADSLWIAYVHASAQTLQSPLAVSSPQSARHPTDT